MKSKCLLLALLLASTGFGQPALERRTMPSVREAAAAFRGPQDTGAIEWWGFAGEMTHERIGRELDQIKAAGVMTVLLGPGRTTNFKYLSPEYFEAVKFAVGEAGRRGMKFLVADEGSYPSGFAGGKFTSDYPNLRMQALVVAERIPAESGQTVSRKLSPATVGAVAVNQADRRAVPLDTANGELSWKAPEGRWQVLVVEHQFRTSPTRYVHHPTGAKDTTYSLQDYLDAKATEVYIKEVHEQYKKYIGSEFGKTFIGFFGDEPDYSISGIPWTPAIFDEFQRRKGYDVRPYAAMFLAQELPEEAKLAKADYWDVWSDLFRDNFYKPQADWCAQNNLSYVVHLNHEDMLMSLVRSEGDFFKLERYVQIPAVDAIWRQIWMNKTADFPKLASSAAHLFGRPHSFTESFAVYGRGFSLEQAKWVIDHQFVRGINLVLSGMFLSREGPGGNPQMPQMPLLVRHVNRLSQLLSAGRPAAEIALYLPGTSMWLGDSESDKATLAAAQGLLEHQRDFDFVDEYSLSSGMTLEGGAFRNASGQSYRAVIVPAATVISRAALDRLRQFASSGGKVLFLGRTPRLVNDKTFLKASGPPDLGFAFRDPNGLTAAAFEVLPKPDVSLDRPIASVKYLHRKWNDADLYFFFNESASKQAFAAAVAGAGTPQWWDVDSGRIRALAGVPGRLPLTLEPYESKVIVVGPLAPGAEPVEPAAGPGAVTELSGDWKLDVAGKQLTTPLKQWADLGFPAFSGPARYTKAFTVPALDKASTYFLECGDVRYSAHAWLNGVDLGDRAWHPFRWDVTKALKAGENTLVLEVRNTASAEFTGDPARRAALEKQAKAETGPARLSVSLAFDIEMLPSGLLEPVRVVAYR
jgi:hypothetical protein